MRENLSAARAAELLMQKDNITLLCHLSLIHISEPTRP